MNAGTPSNLKALRVAAGLSQRQLAARSGIPQPNISAYEKGRRVPSSETQQRLEKALRVPSLEQLRVHKAAIVAAADERHLDRVRVFGSVAEGRADEGSDIDLLVTPRTETSIFDLAGFMEAVRSLLGVDVDVVSDRGTGPAMDRIRAQATPL